MNYLTLNPGTIFLLAVILLICFFLYRLSRSVIVLNELSPDLDPDVSNPVLEIEFNKFLEVYYPVYNDFYMIKQPSPEGCYTRYTLTRDISQAVSFKSKPAAVRALEVHQTFINSAIESSNNRTLITL